MMKIEIKYKIWSYVEHSFNWSKYIVIGYWYVETQWIKYICLQSEKEEWLYLLDIEIKWNVKKEKIELIRKKK